MKNKNWSEYAPIFLEKAEYYKAGSSPLLEL